MAEKLEQIENELIEDFALFDSWADKYQYIIELGQKLEELPEEFKQKKYKIKGCQSSVWLTAAMQDGLVHYKVDSDSVFVKGLASLILAVYNDTQPIDVIEHELKFVDEIGLTQHLAPTRSGGLAAMIKQVKLYALALQETVK